MPPTGNQPVRAASISSSRPDRISGIDSQMNARSDSDLVDPRVLPHRRQTPSGIASPQVTTAAAPASSSVLRQPLAQHLEHRLVARERLAEVEVQQDVLEIEAVLDVPRLVEAEAPPHGLDRLGGDGRVLGHLVEEVARRQLQQQERQQRDAEQQRNDLQQAPQNVGAHRCGVRLLAVVFT